MIVYIDVQRVLRFLQMVGMPDEISDRLKALAAHFIDFGRVEVSSKAGQVFLDLRIAEISAQIIYAHAHIIVEFAVQVFVVGRGAIHNQRIGGDDHLAVELIRIIDQHLTGGLIHAGKIILVAKTESFHRLAVQIAVQAVFIIGFDVRKAQQATLGGAEPHLVIVPAALFIVHHDEIGSFFIQ